MTVQKFIDGYKKANDKTAYIKKHMIKDYVPYNEKLVMCNKLIDSTMYIEIDGVKTFKPNTPVQYVLFSLKVIESYYDITFTSENLLQDYDLLESNGLIEILHSYISDKELVNWNTILQMCTDDELSQRDVVSFLENKINALGISLDTLITAIDKIEQ